MRREQENSAIIDKILSGARWATLLRIIAQSISWICTIFVVRFISSEDYGLNAMLETPLEFLFLLSTFGLDNALVRAKTLEREDLRSAFGWLLIINGMLFLAYFFGSALIAAYFNEPRLEDLAKVLAFIFLLVPFRVIPNALLDRELKFKLKASAELVTSIIAAITTLTLAILGAGIWALITGLLLSRVLLTLILMVLQPWFVMPAFDFIRVRGMIAFGGTMALASAVAITGNLLPVFVAGPRLEPATLGIFVVSLQFALLPLSKIMPVINTITLPAFSKFQGQPDAVAYYLEKSIGIASLALLPIMVGLACVSEEFVMTVLGEKWSPAIIPLALLSLFMPLRGANYFIRQVLGGIGKANIVLKSASITWAIFFVFILAGSNYGVMGLVIAVLITEPLSILATFRLCKQAIDTSFARVANCLRPAIVCSGVMALAVIGTKYLLIEEPGMIRLGAEVAVGVLIYFSVLRLFFAKNLNKALELLKR